MFKDAEECFKNDDDKLQYLKLLTEALMEIENKFCEVPYHGRIQRLERVFAYELYHQFRIIMKNKSDEFEGLRFDGEIVKDNRKPYNYLWLEHAFEFFQPDMVLHKNQLDWNRENQKIILEIKPPKCSVEDFEKDLIKLYNYIYGFNFQVGAFVTFNEDENKILKRVSDIADKVKIDTYEIFKDVYVLNYHSETDTMASKVRVLNVGKTILKEKEELID